MKETLQKFQVIILSFQKSLAILRKDRLVLLLSITPVLIGIIAYVLLGRIIFNDLSNWAKERIIHLMGQGTLGSISTTLFSFFLALIIFLLVNWTFVFVISLISAPFNDVLSGRMEKFLIGKSVGQAKSTTWSTVKRIIWIVLNEIKKIIFIISLGFLALVMSFFPLFTPISFIITTVLLSIQFVDYNWGRHDLGLIKCIQDIKYNFLFYFILGAIFFFLLAIPILNLFFLPFGVLVYSCLWVTRSESFRAKGNLN